MIYTFIKISGREDASLDRYWIDPSGKEYYVDGYKGTHMMWIFDNLSFLQPKEQQEISRLGLNAQTIEKFAGVLYKLGWIRISENVVLMQDNREMEFLADFLARHEHDQNLDVSPAKKITIIKMNPETHEKISIEKIMKKYRGKSLQLAASFDKMSSRDAVKDIINYWDKAKNKDFSKYWRRLKKKKKANYIPNPGVKVEQPLKKNFDYTGESWIDKIKKRRKKRDHKIKDI